MLKPPISEAFVAHRNAHGVPIKRELPTVGERRSRYPKCQFQKVETTADGRE
jgi:hypothetical protein